MSECRKQKPAGTNPAGRTAPSAAQTSILGIPIISRAPGVERGASGRAGEPRGGLQHPALCCPLSCSLSFWPLPTGSAGQGRTEGHTPRIAFPTLEDLEAVCGVEKVKSLVGRQVC